LDLSLLAFIGICFAAAMSGALFPPGPWYKALVKPWWCPPNFVFPLVWTILFAMMAVSGWLIWHRAPAESLVLAMTIYGVQLVLNALWSALFFGMRRMRWALVDVAFLWLSIVAMIVIFWPLGRLAALLMVPYLVWVTIASGLNFAMIRLNPDADRAVAAGNA
jgi:benzodiazapine receptor